MILSRYSAITAALITLALAAPAMAAELTAAKSVADGVTVTVTPTVESPSTWTFKVVLDTHSQDLSDDLVKAASLIAPEGKRYTPVAWEGAAPGGHHREGVLRFAALSPRPASIALEIKRPNEPTPRLFRWQLD
jgi:hypothetical protein